MKDIYAAPGQEFGAAANDSGRGEGTGRHMKDEDLVTTAEMPRPTCGHCGAVLTTHAALCAKCFLDGHRSHPSDGLSLQTPDCAECKLIVQIENEPTT